MISGHREAADPDRACDIDKWWQEIDIALRRGGVSVDEANGTDHVYPLDPEDIDEAEWLDADYGYRRALAPPTFLEPAAVQALAARFAGLDFPAAFDAVDQSEWDELLAGPPENFREEVISEWISVAEFFTAAAKHDGAVVSVMG